VSEQEEKEKAKGAVGFSTALSGYFRQRPMEAIVLLHDIVNDLVDTVNSAEDLRRDLGYFVGQLKILTYLIWTYDHLHIVHKMVADPDTHEDIIEAIARSAKAYHLLHSGEPIAIVDVAYLIDNATSNLFKVIATIVNEANKAS
jgi:hypothetical protein